MATHLWAEGAEMTTQSQNSRVTPRTFCAIQERRSTDLETKETYRLESEVLIMVKCDFGKNGILGKVEHRYCDVTARPSAPFSHAARNSD
jgi:hypothetical protein